MAEIRFLEVDDILHIHNQEIQTAGTTAQLRSKDDLIACIESPKAYFDGNYLMDIFEMASSYLISFCIRHPFIDGNKRVALASCLTFLLVNGYELNEEHDLEFADMTLDFLAHKINKQQLSQFFKERSTNLN